MKKYIIMASAAIALCASAALAQENPSYDALMKAHHAMMSGMEIRPTGDPDRDFVAMMIPHHQGAIDMAKVELQYGKDPEIRKLCEGIIAAQTKEIAQMKAWETTHSGK